MVLSVPHSCPSSWWTLNNTSLAGDLDPRPTLVSCIPRTDATVGCEINGCHIVDNDKMYTACQQWGGHATSHNLLSNLNTMTISHCDVLIVGGGPVGLLLALLLHQRGVDVNIVERQKALYSLPRAVAFDHESRRLFGSVGLTAELDAVLEEVVGKGGEDGTNFVWRDADLKRKSGQFSQRAVSHTTVVADLYFEAPTRSGYPFASSFNQPEVEAVLERAVLTRKIPLMRGYSEVYLNHIH